MSVDQQQGGTNYPLTSANTDVTEQLLDFYLSYSDPLDNFVQPFRLAWLYGFGIEVGSETPIDGYPTPTHALDLIIKDTNNATVFDSTEASVFKTKAWGENKEIVEWLNGSNVCRIVRST